MIEKDAYLKCLEILGKEDVNSQEGAGAGPMNNLLEEMGNSYENSVNLEAEEAF